MDAAPLIPAPVYGLRTWVPVRGPGGDRLAGPLQGTSWPPGGRWLAAECAHGRHPAPAGGCVCGIHAWHPRPATARRVLATRREIPGVIEARGAIEVHDEGFRAERARPHALFLARGRNPYLVHRLAEAYGIGVVPVRTADDVFGWCREHGLGLPEGVVADLLGARAGARARHDGLRLAAALAVAAALVALGLQAIPEREGERVLHGRTGEVRVR